MRASISSVAVANTLPFFTNAAHCASASQGACSNTCSDENHVHRLLQIIKNSQHTYEKMLRSKLNCTQIEELTDMVFGEQEVS